MTITRVVINDQGEFQFVDLAWSQLCELLKGVNRADRKKFAQGYKITLPDGATVKEIRN